MGRDADWYIVRDCTNEGDCDEHGCEDCFHSNTEYQGCVECSNGDLCHWKEEVGKEEP